MDDSQSSWSRYLTASATLRDLGLYCLGAGRQQGALRPTVNRTLDCYAVVLVHAGQGTFRSGTAHATTKVTPGTLLWLYPGLVHSYTPGRSGWSETWALFTGVAAHAYESLGLLRRSGPVQRLTEVGKIQNLFDHLLELAGGEHPAQHAEAAVVIHQLIIEAANQRSDTGRPGPGTVTEDLRSHASSPLTLTEHARRLGMTVPALREQVRRESGTTPKEVILQTRLARAQVLLASGALPIHQVAREVGYPDPAYFSRIFHQRIGLSPRLFREQRSLTSTGTDVERNDA